MKKYVLGILIATFSLTSFAATDTLDAQLKAKYPNLNISNIEKTEVPHLYSATLDGQIVYIDENAEHILIGSMIRLKDQKNLTKELVLNQKSIEWNQLPFQDAIKTVKGNGKRQLAIFSDPTCPYCKKLESQLDQLNNVTIYTFIYPIRPQSVALAEKIWCEDNKAFAWKNALIRNINPSNTKQCKTPIQRNLALGQRLAIEGTPTLFFANGMRVSGTLSAAEIEKIWQESKLND